MPATRGGGLRSTRPGPRAARGISCPYCFGQLSSELCVRRETTWLMLATDLLDDLPHWTLGTACPWCMGIKPGSCGSFQDQQDDRVCLGWMGWLGWIDQHDARAEGRDG